MAAIKSANQKFMDTFGKGDAGGVARLYTETGQLLPTGNDFVMEAQAIQRFWQSAMDMGIKSAKVETVELEEHGNTAIEIGKYSLGDQAGDVMDQGKYVVIWKQEGGQWKLHRDIWNSSLQPK